MEDDQYEDDSEAVCEAFNKAIERLAKGVLLLMALALVFSVAGIL